MSKIVLGAGMKPSTVFCANCGAANPAHAKFCFSCGQAINGDADDLSMSMSMTIFPPGHLNAGRLIRQRYKVLAQIGQGGFGAVYKAEDTDLGQRLVAVKEMSQLGLSPQALAEGVETFKREALMLASLRHEHLPRIYEHFTEDDRWYLVMDYIEGETLEERLEKARDGSLPQVMAIKIALQLCSVLDYLHTRKPPIVFRDLKPSNIILTPEGNLFLIDFGIARHFKPGQAKDTVAFGSPGYAAPEQYGKAQTTPRADIYSLGSILHQMLSGADPSLSPFRYAPLHKYDPVLQRLVEQMLEMDEGRRPASVLEVQQTLEHSKNNPALPLHGRTLRAGQTPVGAPVTRQMAAIRVPPGSPAPRLMHEHHYGVVRAVAWSPDSVYAASATDAIVRVWHAAQGYNLSSYREHLGLIKHMVWSPVDARIASISEENKIRIWDSNTGKTLSSYPGDPNSNFNPNLVQWLAWSATGRYLAVAGSKFITVWDTSEEEPIVQLRNKYQSGCRGLCWSPDGKRLAVTQGRSVSIHRLEERGKTLHYRYSSSVNAVAWSPNGTYLASGGDDRVVHVWDVQTNRLVGIYHGHLKPISALSWSPNNACLVSGSLASNIHVWDAMTGQSIVSFHAHVGDILTVAWSPDGRSILSGGSDCRVYVWNAP
ncbi:MAG TPA: WD40 repeat domain-containing serine/threonine-protein kinase [Ktedonobacteraceae bacterium]